MKLFLVVARASSHLTQLAHASVVHLLAVDERRLIVDGIDYSMTINPEPTPDHAPSVNRLQDLFAEFFPQRLDVLFLSAGHNYQQRTPAEMFALIDSFVADFRALRTGTPIIVTGQNPQLAPASAQLAHNERQKALAAYWRERGFGYVPVTSSG
ncbi:hypothetical protein Z045_24790 [Rhodococcus pyridinivorans KG-16]|uniref:Uncharacterized protein n=1 Tax=Rhodococcus pyridinivorans KG-16 TaxID=1441730 RepID=A0A0V9UDN3_9NOCA|nr:hypothetical protein Z045_24790 [Rhodococcus pyridinivorans KG-16]